MPLRGRRLWRASDMLGGNGISDEFGVARHSGFLLIKSVSSANARFAGQIHYQPHGTRKPP